MFQTPMATDVKKSKRKKSTARKKAALLAAEEMLATPEKQFINIYERDELIAAKSKLSWLIVGLLVLALVIFWFWSMKTTIKKNDADSNLKEITAEITNIIKEFRGLVSDTRNAINQTTTDIATQESLEQIKNEVLAQIQINSESANWPQHLSKPLGLALKYPTNWFKQEKRDSLVLSSYNLSSTSTPEVLATLTITRIADKRKDIKIIDLLDKPENYQKSTEEIFIDLVPVEKYDLIAVSKNDISSILFVKTGINIYKIEIYSVNGKNIFEPVISRILSTIDLL